MTLTALAVLPATLYRVAISPLEGLILPASGFYMNDERVSISTNASAGRVMPTAVNSVQPV
eukprot:5292-Eustigmatos_ZCMA.PRE.1